MSTCPHPRIGILADDLTSAADGADTMEAVLDALQIASFDLLGDFEPGFPIAMADWAGRRLVLGMKAGGFGSPGTLLQAANHLRNQQERIA